MFASREPMGLTRLTPQFSRDLRDVMLEIEWDKEVKAVSVTAEGPFPRGVTSKNFMRLVQAYLN